jgi:hypothetical protein
MEIPQENTMENSGKQNPEMGFKSPPEHKLLIISDLGTNYTAILRKKRDSAISAKA